MDITFMIIYLSKFNSVATVNAGIALVGQCTTPASTTGNCARCRVEAWSGQSAAISRPMPRVLAISAAPNLPAARLKFLRVHDPLDGSGSEFSTGRSRTPSPLWGRVGVGGVPWRIDVPHLPTPTPHKGEGRSSRHRRALTWRR